MAGDALSIALVGDHDPGITAHRMIPLALELAAGRLGVDAAAEWIATDTIGDAAQLASFDGFWCVPGSPYRDTDGALRAIRFAREAGRPFLGTCGGFQHALVEYARNVLGWRDADHAESNPGAERAVVTPLVCGLVEVRGNVRFHEGSRCAAAYGRLEADEGYHCNYGLNPSFRAQLTGGPLSVSAEDDAGDVRAVELTGHPFFVATLFQPERGAATGIAPPLAVAFLDAVRRSTTARTLHRILTPAGR